MLRGGRSKGKAFGSESGVPERKPPVPTQKSMKDVKSKVQVIERAPSCATVVVGRGSCTPLSFATWSWSAGSTWLSNPCLDVQGLPNTEDTIASSPAPDHDSDAAPSNSSLMDTANNVKVRLVTD